MLAEPTPCMKPCANTGCSTPKPAAVPTYIAMLSRPCLSISSPNLAADAAERVVPAHAPKLAVDSLHGIEQSIGRVVHPMLLQPLEASVPARRHMVVVGFDVDDAVALNRDLEPTEGLANPAKRLHCLGHDRPSL